MVINRDFNAKKWKTGGWVASRSPFFSVRFSNSTAEYEILGVLCEYIYYAVCFSSSARWRIKRLLRRAALFLWIMPFSAALSRALIA